MSIDKSLTSILYKSQSILICNLVSVFLNTSTTTFRMWVLDSMSSVSWWYSLYITGYAKNNEITERDRDTKAIHHAGIPAAPPVSIAVSRPPPNSAPINTNPQFPRSVTDQHDRGPSSKIDASRFTSESTNGRNDNAFSDVSISNSRVLSILSVPFALSASVLELIFVPISYTSIVITISYVPVSQSANLIRTDFFSISPCQGSGVSPPSVAVTDQFSTGMPSAKFRPEIFISSTSLSGYA